MSEELNISNHNTNRFLVQSNTIALLPSLYSTDNHLPDHEDEDGGVVKGRSKPVSNVVRFLSITHSGDTVQNEIHYSAAWGLLRPNDQELLTKIFYLFSEQDKFMFADQIEVNRKDFPSKKEFERARETELRKQIDSNQTILVSRGDLLKSMGYKSRGSFGHIINSLSRLQAVTINKRQKKIFDQSGNLYDEKEDDENRDSAESMNILTYSFKNDDSIGRITLSSDIILDFLTGNFFIIDIDWLVSVPKGRHRTLLDFVNAHLHQQDDNIYFCPINEIIGEVLKMGNNETFFRQYKSKLKNILKSFENLGLLEPSITVGPQVATFEVFCKHEFEVLVNDKIELVEQDAVCFRAGPKILKCKQYKKDNFSLRKKLSHGVMIPKVNTEKKRALHDRLYDTTLTPRYVDFYLASCEKDKSYPSIGERYDRSLNRYSREFTIVEGGFKISYPTQDDKKDLFIELDYDILENRVEFFELFFKYSEHKESFLEKKGGWFRSLVEGKNYDKIMHEKFKVLKESKEKPVTSPAEDIVAEKKVKLSLTDRFLSISMKDPIDNQDHVLVEEALQRIGDVTHRKILAKHIKVKKGNIIYLVMPGFAISSYVMKYGYDSLLGNVAVGDNIYVRFLEMSADSAEELEESANDIDLRTDLFYGMNEEDDEYVDNFEDHAPEPEITPEEKAFMEFYGEVCLANFKTAKMLLLPIIPRLSDSEKHVLARSFENEKFIDSPEIKEILFTHYEKPADFLNLDGGLT